METKTSSLIVVSNRLPVRIETDGDGWRSVPSSGGLATALSGMTDEDSLWVGWPGIVLEDRHRTAVTKDLARHGLYPVHLSEEQEQLFYRGFCNTVLWPLFHYFTSHVDVSEREWQAYVGVNRRFAEVVLRQCGDAARVWVHDFHLMLLPAMLREARPDLEIGFFLHIPFPSSEIYRLLPCREDLLQGVLAADYIGFHTGDYARHFRSSCLRVLGLESAQDEIQVANRSVRIGVDPIGIDTATFRKVMQSPRTAELFGEYGQRYQDRKMLLGIERLDYTKGIPLKLQAFERFLERRPERAGEVTLLQVLVPSRLNHPEYQLLKSEIEEAIGRINGTYGRPGVTPIEYLHRSLQKEELAALYRFAHACLVTPIRDGMNLVAQEYVLCQALDAPMPACRGALVLSEFAGASHSLPRALLVNPWNVEKAADAIEAALEMSDDERRQRLLPMAARVEAMESRRWAKSFLSDLAAAGAHNRSHGGSTVDAATADQIAAAWRDAPRRVLLLDYDGTMRELTRTPEEAAPGEEILELLGALAATPDTEIHLVSGRPREVLAEWFGHLPLHLCGEHGFAWRPAGEEWQELENVDLSWIPGVRTMLEEVADEVPGAFVEEKRCSLAWHYRVADPDYGRWRARELLAVLEGDVANLPVEVLPGHCVIEVRAAGVHKGRYVTIALHDTNDEDFVLCAGDDRTDHDMYAHLPPGVVTIHVGGKTDEARYTVDGPAQLRRLLGHLVAAARRAPPGE